MKTISIKKLLLIMCLPSFILFGCRDNKKDPIPDNKEIQVCFFNNLNDLKNYVSTIGFGNKQGYFYQPYFNESFLENADGIYHTFGLRTSLDIDDIYDDGINLYQEYLLQDAETSNKGITIETRTLFGFNSADEISDYDLQEKYVNHDGTIYQYNICGTYAFKISIPNGLSNQEDLINGILTNLDFIKGTC